MTRRTVLYATAALVGATMVLILGTAAISSTAIRPAGSIEDTYASAVTPTPAAPPVVRPVASYVMPVPGRPTAIPAELPLPARFAVPAVEIDAPVVEAGLDENGNMEDPDGPDDVAWYTFTGKPGGGGNAVFSGHLDWYATGPAIFWRLREAITGDIISITLADGTAVDYAIAWSRTYPVAETPMAMALETTSVEAVTIITCAGDFIDGDYTDRTVIRAFRVQD